MELPTATTRLLETANGFVLREFRDVDDFLLKFYEYYAFKGLLTICLKEICDVLTLGFMICFSVFLFEFVEWTAVVNCRDEQTCQNLTDQMSSNPFHHTPNFYSMLSALYFLLFLTYWLWTCRLAVRKISCAIDRKSVV